MALRERMIAASDDIADGGEGIRFVVAGPGGTVAAFAIRWRGTVRAYVNSCPHQGSELDWLPGRFFDAEARYLICATHGAVFEPDTGVCVAGPCTGAALARLPVDESDGGVECPLEAGDDPG